MAVSADDIDETSSMSREYRHEVPDSAHEPSDVGHIGIGLAAGLAIRRERLAHVIRWMCPRAGA
jgi:hypothetical protein